LRLGKKKACVLRHTQALVLVNNRSAGAFALAQAGYGLSDFFNFHLHLLFLLERINKEFLPLPVMMLS
jgi:hypothetical protein